MHHRQPAIIVRTPQLLEIFSSVKGKPLTPVLIYSCYMIPRDRGWPTGRQNSLFRTFRNEKGESFRSDGRRQGEIW